MIIMSLSYVQRTNDQSQIRQYVGDLKIFALLTCDSQSLQSALLDQWAQFLIEDSLIPENQISTDDFAGPLANQTNLAIKGIVGIKAMSEIASLLGDQAKSNNYSVRIPKGYFAKPGF